MKKDSATFKKHLRRIAAKGGKAVGKSKVRGGKSYYSKIAKERWARERAKRSSEVGSGGAGNGSTPEAPTQPAKARAGRAKKAA